MIRSFAFTTQGRLHSQEIETFLMPTLLMDRDLFLWLDLEDPTEEMVLIMVKLGCRALRVVSPKGAGDAAAGHNQVYGDCQVQLS